MKEMNLRKIKFKWRNH